jgi:hypothetical protein
MYVRNVEGGDNVPLNCTNPTIKLGKTRDSETDISIRLHTPFHFSVKHVLKSNSTSEAFCCTRRKKAMGRVKYVSVWSRHFRHRLLDFLRPVVFNKQMSKSYLPRSVVIRILTQLRYMFRQSSTILF